MSPAAPLPLTTLAAQLTALGMEHAATALPQLIDTAAREHLDPSAFLGRVLTPSWSARTNAASRPC